MQNKRILIVSDTHGSIQNVKKLLKTTHDIDLILHLGDNVSDAKALERYTGAGVYFVKGNCDFSSSVPLKKIISVCGKKLLITHGHEYGVKYSLTRLVHMGMESEADAVFFGHTHIPLVEYHNGMFVMNPGSASLPRRGRATCGLVLVGDFGVTGEIRTIE